MNASNRGAATTTINAVADFIPPLEALRIGWELQNGTVWFGVALANARIGCD